MPFRHRIGECRGMDKNPVTTSHTHAFRCTASDCQWASRYDAPAYAAQHEYFNHHGQPTVTVHILNGAQMAAQMATDALVTARAHLVTTLGRAA